MYMATGKRMEIEWFLPLTDATSLANQSDPILHTIPDSHGHPDIDSETMGEDNIEIERNMDENIDLRIITRENLEKTLKKLENKIKQRIDSDPVGYNKAVDILNKTVDSLPATVDAALQKCLCSFGKTVTQVCNQI